jgi:GTP-binding protein HflX
MLILDIFAQHARSVEGKAQVELAQLNYLKQRLRGWGDSLSRQVGGRAAGGVGIGGRGPGETKIETDRRRINTRVAVLRRRLAGMATTRELSRNTRRRDQVPSVAIIGYTNAGKSSLLNRLTDADVLVEDALFATLDPTTRRARSADGRVYTLTDTVGFVRHLPTGLVEAFKSTLEETAQAALLVHVVDASGTDPLAQVAAVRAVLGQIGADQVPELMVVNKIDVALSDTLAALRHALPQAVYVSAATGEGIDDLRAAIEARLPQPGVLIEALVPWSRGDLIDRAHRTGEVLATEATADGTRLKARVHAGLAAELAPFAPKDDPPHQVAIPPTEA